MGWISWTPSWSGRSLWPDCRGMSGLGLVLEAQVLECTGDTHLLSRLREIPPFPGGTYWAIYLELGGEDDGDRLIRDILAA